MIGMARTGPLTIKEFTNFLYPNNSLEIDRFGINPPTSLSMILDFCFLSWWEVEGVTPSLARQFPTSPIRDN